MDPTVQHPTRPVHQNRTTNVYVSPQVNHAVAPPDFAQPQTLPPQGAPATANGKKINWGGIAKGVAMIGGVVLVGVVAATLVSSVVMPAIMGTSVGASVVTGVGAAGHAVIDIGTGVMTVAGKSVLAAVEAFGLGFGGSAVASSATAGAAATPLLFAKGAVTTVGALIAGIGTSLATLPLIAKPLAAIPLLEPNMVHGHADMAASMAATKKQTIINQHAVQHAQSGDYQFGADSLLDDHAVQAGNKALKTGHHAAEEAEHPQQQRRTAQQNILARVQQASRSWTDRTATARQPVGPIRSRAQQSFTENLATDAQHAQELPSGGRA